MERIRVLLADDQPIIFEGVRHILGPEYEIVGEVQDGLALLAAAAQLKPDLIISDISMPRLDGIEAVRRIKKAARDVQIVFLTMHAEAAYVTAALEAGGSAFVLKSSAGDELLTAIGEVRHGRSFVTQALVGARAKKTRGGLPARKPS